MYKNTIKINERKCYACGKCISACPEKAIQIIDNKARVMSDLYCKCYETCTEACPEKAITIEDRNNAQYDERKFIIESIIPHGKNTIISHLRFLKSHLETEYHKIAIDVLREHGMLSSRKELGRVPHHRQCKLEAKTFPKNKNIDRK